jgi:hypothetical protein
MRVSVNVDTHVSGINPTVSNLRTVINKYDNAIRNDPDE